MEISNELQDRLHAWFDSRTPNELLHIAQQHGFVLIEAKGEPVTVDPNVVLKEVTHQDGFTEYRITAKAPKPMTPAQERLFKMKQEMGLGFCKEAERLWKNNGTMFLLSLRPLWESICAYVEHTPRLQVGEASNITVLQGMFRNAPKAFGLGDGFNPINISKNFDVIRRLYEQEVPAVESRSMSMDSYKDLYEAK